MRTHTPSHRGAPALAMLSLLLPVFGAFAPRAAAEDYGVLLAATEMVHPSYHLHVANEDLLRMREAFVRGLGIPEARLTVLAGEQLTRQNVEEAFWHLRRDVKATRGDRVFVYFTGHGAKAPRADGRTAARALLLHTARPPVRGNAFHPLHTFTEDDLRDWLTPIREAGVRTVLFLDCGFDPAPGTKSAGLAGDPMPPVPFQARMAADVELSAAVPGGVAYPRRDGGGSLFTYHLSQTLLDFDAPRIDANTLHSRVQDAMHAERQDADTFFQPARAEYGAALVVDRSVGVVFLPVVTFDGAPLAGVEVIEEGPNGERNSLGRTDPEGRLRIRGRVHTLRYWLRKPGFVDTPGTLPIAWGEVELEPVPLLPSFAWVSGEVRSEDDEPVAGASVRIVGTSAEDFLPGFHAIETQTDVDGGFAMRVRPGRSYRLRARTGASLSPPVAVHDGKSLEPSRYESGVLLEQRYVLDEALHVPNEGGITPSRRAYLEAMHRGRDFFDGGHFASARGYFEFARERGPEDVREEVDLWLRRCNIADRAQELRLKLDEAFEAERYTDVRRHWRDLERLLEEEGQNLGSLVVARFSEGVLGTDGILRRSIDQDVPEDTRRTFAEAEALDQAGDLLAAASRYRDARRGANDYYRITIEERLRDLDVRVEDAFQEAVRKGRSALRGGDATGARAWADEALRLRPDHPLGRALWEDADREDVAAEVKAAVLEGERRLTLGEPEAAVDSFRMALASKANRHYRLRAEEGLVRASKAASLKWQDVARDRTLEGDAAGAAEAWERVLLYEPGFPPALTALEELGWKAEVRETLAFERLRRWMQYEGDDPEQIRRGIDEMQRFLAQFPDARRAPQIDRALRRLERRPARTLPTGLVVDEELEGQGQDAESGLPLRVRLAADPSIVLCLVPAGSFVLGDASGEGDADESPVHQVSFDRPFYVGLTEVTWGQYLRYGEEAGLPDPPAPRWGVQDDHPVVNVSWSEARAFCTSRGGRLPTEAEWEYAAKGPSETRYPWGDDIDPSRGNFDSSQLRRTTPVARYPFGASRLGPLDMAGNVWEWCEDWYDASWYSKLREAALAGSGPLTGGQRVLRGGSWFDPESYCRTTNRYMGDADTRSDIVGFRLVVDAYPDLLSPEDFTSASQVADAGMLGGETFAETRGDAGPARGEADASAEGEASGDAAAATTGDDAAEAAAAPTRIDPVSGDVTHVVQEGETLPAMARRFYGKSRFAAAIAKRNGIRSLDQIRAGMELVLPRIPGVTLNLEGAVTAAAPGSSGAPGPGETAASRRTGPRGDVQGPGEVGSTGETALSTGETAVATEEPPAVRTPSGLSYRDELVGAGAIALPGNMVTVHYAGTLEDGTQIDSTYDRGEPLQFRLGEQAVIAGLDEGIVGMRAGGLRRITIPPSLAFGTRGLPGRVPPDATVLFQVELVSVR